MKNAPQPGLFPPPLSDVALDRWHAAAVASTPAQLFGTARSLAVVVPHADDETLGCGGLIAAATIAGLAVTVIVLTDGAASHPGSTDWPPARLARRRRRELCNAVAILTDCRGHTRFGGAPDGQLRIDADMAATIPPADLYVTCWQDDPHPDHAAAFAIARRAAAAAGAPLLAFPLWVLTTDCAVPALPVHRIDVCAQLATKRAALAAHASQLGGLVRDVPGFILDDQLQNLFVRSDELFVRAG